MPWSMAGWREALLIAVAILAAYLGYALYRLARTQERPQAVPAPRDDSPWRERIEDELAALRAELAGMRAEIEGLRAMRAVSPQYGEAVELAGQGLSAQDIAARCGISVGEAELVRALSRKGE
jgi:DNA-directed RNA polymerase specialized sigma24 family protein